MKIEKRIAFACFTGAALGAVVALQLDLFWWLGILFGGATGYVSYSFREILRAAVTAWNTLAGTRLNRGAFKAGVLNAAQFLAVLACIICCVASVAVLTVAALMLLSAAPTVSSQWEPAPMMPEPAQTSHLFWVATAAGVLVLGMVLLAGSIRSADRKGLWLGMLGCIAATPLVLPITLAVIFVPRGALLLLKLARQTLILIHSEVRLLCLTDALLGALVGYLCGNALIGGGIGALLGWGNYRFISIKWLKLAKAA